MDPSGSPRWLVTSDPWQASDTVATCKIPAASSSAREARAGVEEAADSAAFNQSPECSPRTIASSSSCEDPQDPGILRSSPARGHREAGSAIRIGEGETTSAGSSIGETDFLPRRSILPERKSASCNTMPPLPRPGRHCGKPNTTRKLGVADGENLLQKLKQPPLPLVDPVGEVLRLQQVVVDLQRQLQQHGVPVVPQGVPVVPSRISGWQTVTWT